MVGESEGVDLVAALDAGGAEDGYAHFLGDGMEGTEVERNEVEGVMYVWAGWQRGIGAGVWK